MEPENQEINSVDVPVEENLANDDINAILTLLRETIELNKQKEEQQEQLKIESDNVQKILDEENAQKELDQKIISDEKEQQLIDSENEFRENLLEKLDSTNSKLDQIITYNSQSDGFAESIKLLPEKLDTIIENTEHSEKQQINDELSYYANLSLIFIVFVCVPVVVSYKIIKPFFNKFY